MSKIFTQAELQALQSRKQGNYHKHNALFSGRVKTKIIELLQDWFPIKEDLEELIRDRRKKKR